MESLSHIITPLLSNKSPRLQKIEPYLTTAVDQMVKFLEQQFKHLSVLSTSIMIDLLLTAPAWCAGQQAKSDFVNRLKRMSLLF